MDIEIGKFTLESLTTGMYTDPEIVYREYIQNSVDALDEAVEKGVLRADESRIEIIIDDTHQEITIKDNGAGISREKAAKVLLDIGNSSKRHSSNRGFRGIGRLGGLSYCQKLSFCTSAAGEEVKTIVTFDCEKLKQLLVPGQYDSYNLQQVLDNVTEIRYLSEQASSHYFIVKMEGVDDISELLSVSDMKSYISQVAPLPYAKEFYRQKEIKEHLQECNVILTEYPIFVGRSFETLSQVFKLNKKSFKADKNKEIPDSVQGISFFDIRNGDELIATGWYADCNWYGTLCDDRISGIRVRKGNILIGDGRTLSPFFKEQRFNGWAQGEVFIVSDGLIPNARRDDFEKNETYLQFVEGIRATVGTEVTNKLRIASRQRNNPNAKVLRDVQTSVSKVEDILETGFLSSYEKDQTAQNLLDTKKKLYAIPKSAPTEILEKKQELTERIDELTQEVETSSNFRTKKDITSDFSKKEKKIVQAMMEVLSKNFDRSMVNHLFEEFLEELKGGGK